MDLYKAKKLGQAYPLRRSTVALMAMEAAVAIRRIRLTVKQVCVRVRFFFVPFLSLSEVAEDNPYPRKSFLSSQTKILDR